MASSDYQSGTEPSSSTDSESQFPWSEYRLLLLSAVVGVVGGLSAQIFIWLLSWGERLFLWGIAGYVAPEPGTLNPAPHMGPMGLWLIPVATTVGGLLSGILVYTFAPEAEGHGTDAAVESFHYKGGQVRSIVPPIKAIASAITIGSGGAAGREGPTAQISVGVSSILATYLRLSREEHLTIVLAGMAAGLAAIFRSPLGMAIFAVEILYGSMAFEGEALIYTVVAAVVAYAVNGLFVGWQPLFLFSDTLHFSQPLDLIGYLVLGIVAGLVGAFEPSIFYGIRDLFKRIPVPAHVKPAIGGLLMGLLAMFLPQTVSAGYGWVQMAMTGGYVGWSLIFLALAKLLAMSLTISSGGSGGVFGPNVYIGGMVGAWVAFAVDSFLPGAALNPSAFVVVGMAAVFAGTARVPIATLVMVAEMTGSYGLIVPSMLATSIAFVVQRSITMRFRYPRLYESQVERRSDSPTRREHLIEVAFKVLEKGSAVNLQHVSFPQLANLIKQGTPISISNGQGRLFSINIEKNSPLAGESVMQAFGEITDIVAVAVIRGKQVLLPRGDLILELRDTILLAATEAGKTELLRTLSQNPKGRPKRL